MGKTAIITGIGGQDGAYLAQSLLEKGYRVIGTDRRRVDQHYWRLQYLGINKDVEYEFMDLMEIGNIFRTLEKYQPDEVFNLAAQSFVGASFEMPLLTADVDAIGVLRIIEAIRTMKTNSRFYQASTSEMFGRVQDIPQDESTPFYPRSPYGVAKLYGHWITKNYRESYDMYLCSGILFNHESPLRGLEFVTRKITNTVSKIKYGQADRLVLGNMDAKRDWGYAKDYVEGMWKMLQMDEPDDYVLASGKTYTVRDFVERSFRCIDIDIEWEGSGIDEKGIDSKTGQTLVSISEKFYRPAEVDLLLGNASKAKEKLDWEPTVDLDGLIAIMMENDLNLVSSK